MNAFTPQCRLTLAQGSPVMKSDVVDSDRIYLSAYGGDQVPIWNGSDWVSRSVPQADAVIQLSAFQPHEKAYDLFAIDVGGVLRAVVGHDWPALTSTPTARGLHKRNGLWVNSGEIGARTADEYFTVPADRATHLGAFYARTEGKCSMMFKPVVEYDDPAYIGGSDNLLGLSNNFNRVLVVSRARDSRPNPWLWQQSSWMAYGENFKNKVSWIDSLGESFVMAYLQTQQYLFGLHGVSPSINSSNIMLCWDGQFPTDNFAQQVAIEAGQSDVTIAATVEDMQEPKYGLHNVSAQVRVIQGKTEFYYGGYSLRVALEM